MKNDFDELIRLGKDADALRHLADEYYKNGKMGHTRKLLLERAADRIDQLEQTWEWSMYQCAEREIARLRKECAALVAESVKREKALAKLEAEVAAARNAVAWTPVTERLPKTEKPVQVYMPKLHMSVQTGFYTKYYGEDDGEWYEHWVASGDVTHWRELPAPPKGEETNETN